MDIVFNAEVVILIIGLFRLFFSTHFAYKTCEFYLDALSRRDHPSDKLILSFLLNSRIISKDPGFLVHQSSCSSNELDDISVVGFEVQNEVVWFFVFIPYIYSYYTQDVMCLLVQKAKTIGRFVFLTLKFFKMYLAS